MTNRTRPGRRNRMRAALAATSTGAERAVYMALESYADASGVAWPSRATIADLTGYSVGAVKKAVSRLREVGLVESVQVIRRGGIVGCRYWLTTYDDGTGSPLVEVGPRSEVEVEVEHQDAAVEVGPRSEVEVEVEHQDAAAARALQVMSDLPLPRTEILDLLRQIGSGDSWAGLIASRTALERSFEGARVPGAVLRARLRQVVVRPSAGSGALGVGCSVCDRGFVELPDGRLRRCEVCHTRRVLRTA
jgi:hypothetical protein